MRRFRAGLRNLNKIYLPLMDAVIVYDNSDGADGKVIAEKRVGRPLKVIDRDRWTKIQERVR